MKLTVVPGGRPLADMAIFPVNPSNGESEAVRDPGESRKTIAYVALVLSEKSVIPRITVRYWLTDPLVPITVMRKSPGDPEQDSVEFTLLPRVTLVGFSEHVTPAPADHERLTVPVNPFNALTVTMYVAVVPTGAATVGGFAEREKLFTIMLIVIELNMVPEVAVTVTV